MIGIFRWQAPEVWKPIPGYLNKYEVSNYGRVKRVALSQPEGDYEPLIKSIRTNGGKREPYVRLSRRDPDGRQCDRTIKSLMEEVFGD